jgi:hypothetical protein
MIQDAAPRLRQQHGDVTHSWTQGDVIDQEQLCNFAGQSKLCDVVITDLHVTDEVRDCCFADSHDVNKRTVTSECGVTSLV